MTHPQTNTKKIVMLSTCKVLNRSNYVTIVFYMAHIKNNGKSETLSIILLYSSLQEVHAANYMTSSWELNWCFSHLTFKTDHKGRLGYCFIIQLIILIQVLTLP